MPTESQELKEHLLQVDPEFRTLFTTHRELDGRLHDLSHKPYLTDSEQFEEVTLKKKKLQLKDQMEGIIRRYRAAHSAHA
jgi:uncharacterized protein YdcH (DUF465 family)